LGCPYFSGTEAGTNYLTFRGILSLASEEVVRRVIIGPKHEGLELRRRGYSHVCAAFASGAMRRVYKQMGLSSSVLAPPRFYWGAERYPVRFEVSESVDALAERWVGN
jgi:hypothetical protein